MFQNPNIAKEHGEKITQGLKAEGVPHFIAEAMGRRAEADKLVELDNWTVEHVGLD